jgi:hypothetical protein
MSSRVVLVLATVLATGCASLGLNTGAKADDLEVGMTMSEVTALLGEVDNQKATPEGSVVTYRLHRYGVGWYPLDCYFDPDGELVAWGVDEAGYQAEQQKLAAFAETLSEATGGVAGDPGPGDPQLLQWMAGEYFGYSGTINSSGGTTTYLMLCPDATFAMRQESSYSGDLSGGGNWLSAAEGTDRGRWSVTGSQQGGKITMAYQGGDTFTNDWQACGNGCFQFGSLKVGYKGPPVCN